MSINSKQVAMSISNQETFINYGYQLFQINITKIIKSSEITLIVKVLGTYSN